MKEGKKARPYPKTMLSELVAAVRFYCKDTKNHTSNSDSKRVQVQECGKTPSKVLKNRLYGVLEFMKPKNQ